MYLLPPIDKSSRVAAVLDALGVKWTRDQVTEPTGAPESDPDRRVKVQYNVGDGPLEGQWEGTGADPDLEVLEAMLAQLDEDWRHHMDEFRRIAAALRIEGR